MLHLRLHPVPIHLFRFAVQSDLLRGIFGDDAQRGLGERQSSFDIEETLDASPIRPYERIADVLNTSR